MKSIRRVITRLIEDVVQGAAAVASFWTSADAIRGRRRNLRRVFTRPWQADAEIKGFLFPAYVPAPASTLMQEAQSDLSTICLSASCANPTCRRTGRPIWIGDDEAASGPARRRLHRRNDGPLCFGGASRLFDSTPDLR